jgi:hypothetical protein
MSGWAYINGITGVAASYPSEVFEPFDVRDDSQLYPGLSESFTAPALVGGRSVWQLEMQPAQQSGFGVTLSSVAQVVVPWGVTPAAGQVAVDFARGKVEFPAAQAEVGAYVVGYTGRGSLWAAYLFNRLQAELVATQERVEELVIGGEFVLPADGVDGQVLTSDGAGYADWTTLGALALLSTVDLTAHVGASVLPVENGGTGATTAATARTNLEVYSETEVDDLLAARLPRNLELAAKTAAHTLVAGDAGKCLHFKGLSAGVDLTVPEGVLSAGAQIAVWNRDATHDVTFVEATGNVSITSPDGLVLEPGRMATLIYAGEESGVHEWGLSGGLTTP